MHLPTRLSLRHLHSHLLLLLLLQPPLPSPTSRLFPRARVTTSELHGNVTVTCSATCNATCNATCRILHPCKQVITYAANEPITQSVTFQLINHQHIRHMTPTNQRRLLHTHSPVQRSDVTYLPHYSTQRIFFLFRIHPSIHPTLIHHPSHVFNLFFPMAALPMCASPCLCNYLFLAPSTPFLSILKCLTCILSHFSSSVLFLYFSITIAALWRAKQA